MRDLNDDPAHEADMRELRKASLKADCGDWESATEADRRWEGTWDTNDEPATEADEQYEADQQRYLDEERDGE